MPRQFEDVIRIVQVNLPRFHADVRVFLREYPPRCRRILHHRHQRGALGIPCEQFRLERRCARQEVGERSAADHVGTAVGETENPLREDVRQEFCHRRPPVRLVTESLDERQSGALIARTVFVQRVFQTKLRPEFALFVRGHAAVIPVIIAVILDIARIEFEAIHTVLGHEEIEHIPEPLRCIGIAHVHHAGKSVPPVAERSRTVGVMNEVSLRIGFAVYGRIRRDKRAHPQHHGETEIVEFPDHRTGIRNRFQIELAAAVEAHPAVVNHHDPRRESVVDNPVRVA